VCDLETSRMGAPYIYDISRLRVNVGLPLLYCLTNKLHVSATVFSHYQGDADYVKRKERSDIHMSVHRNIIPNYSQQDATFLEYIYFYRRSTCFRQFLLP
jgi:hypothetical protein